MIHAIQAFATGQSLNRYKIKWLETGGMTCVSERYYEGRDLKLFHFGDDVLTEPNQEAGSEVNPEACTPLQPDRPQDHDDEMCHEDSVEIQWMITHQKPPNHLHHNLYQLWIHNRLHQPKTFMLKKNRL